MVIYFVMFFLILGAGMAIGRGTTDALFFKRYGIEYLPVMYMILSLMLFLVSTGYAAFADRLPPERFFKILNSILIVTLIAAWLSMTFFPFDSIYPIYFLIYEISSELLILHAALYLAKNLDSMQAKRLTPIILAGSQIGTIFGGLVLAISAPVFGVQNLIIVWCVLLSISIAMLFWWHKRSGESLFFRHPRKNTNKIKQSMQDITAGIKFMNKSALLKYSSYALFFMVIIFYILCYSVNKIYTETFKTEESLAAFFGILVVVTNSIALVLQLFVTNRVIHNYGIKTVNLVFPLASMFSYAALIFSFALPSAIISSINKDSLMPAFRNPVRNMFYNALPNFIQGRARAMSVLVVIPLALLVCGGILWTVQRLDNPLYYLVIGFFLAGIYFYFNRRMNHAYVMEVINNLKDRLFIPGEQEENAIRSGGSEVVNELITGIRHKDEKICITYATIMSKTFPDQAIPILMKRLQGEEDSIRDQLFKILIKLEPEEFSNYLWNEYKTADIHLQSTILKALFSIGDTRARAQTSSLIANRNPRLKSVGIYGCIVNKSCDNSVYAHWNNLLQSGNNGEIFAGMDVFNNIGDKISSHTLSQIDTSVFPKLLNSDNSRIKKSSLQIMSLWPEEQMIEMKNDLREIYTSNDPDIRCLVIKSAHILRKDDYNAIIKTALNDSHPLVRKQAVDTFTSKDSNEKLISWVKNKNAGTPRTQSTILSRLTENGTPNHIMENIALTKIQDAQTLSQMLSLFQNHPDTHTRPSVELLVFTLQERLEQTIDLSLQAMESLEDTSTIRLIQAGINNNDPQIAAQAMEALRNLNNQHLAITLIDIMEELNNKDSSSTTSKDQLSSTLEKALIWCAKRNDPWLKACANDALTEYK
ncbi:MAG: hypothetical protein GXP13_02110 [Gammaproteobacteria bacterium]|nr:hypothetical protein [Gammaproteobacteria bacterium]